MSKSDAYNNLLRGVVKFNFPFNDFHRSTIVHSNTIPPKEQSYIPPYKERQIGEEAYNKNSRDTDGISMNVMRSMQASQRIPLGTPFPLHL